MWTELRMLTARASKRRRRKNQTNNGLYYDMEYLSLSHHCETKGYQ